jgi:integrase
VAVYKRKDEWGDTWRYRRVVRLPDGTKVRIAGTPTINTKRAAEEVERAHVERVLNPPPEQRERKLMSAVFDVFLDEYVATANNKASEVAAKRTAIDCHLRPELGKLQAHEVTEAIIDSLAAKLHKKPKLRGEGTLGPKTVKNVLQTLRKALRWAKKRGWVDDVPEIEMPRLDEEEIRFLSDPELEALLEASAAEPQWYAAELLASDAGLRQGELRALQWTDINGVTGKIRVSRSRWRNEDGTPKSRKPRSVPMTARLATALKAIEKTSKLRGPYVLSRREDGGAYGAEYMTEAMGRLSRKAKLTDVGWHTLRHTFCTRLAMRNVPPRVIQEWAGHASIATTMRYMHFVPAHADEMIALLDGGTVARARHGAGTAAANESEGGELIQL